MTNVHESGENNSAGIELNRQWAQIETTLQ